MPNGYVRQSVASIVNGNIINASDFNNEYNALLGAFDVTTGHNHDGTTTGTGSAILKLNGVSYPASPSSNTVPVVTSTNTITYEKVPNAALLNAGFTLGSTSVTLGGTTTSVGALTLLNATTSGTFTLGGSLIATGFSIVGPTLSNVTLSGTATGTWNGGGTSTLTAFTLNNSAISGPVTGTWNGGGTATLNNFLLSNAQLSSAFDANSKNINNAVIVSPTITTPTINGGSFNSGAINSAAISSNSVAITQAASDNSTKLATTAQVASQFTTSGTTNGFLQAGNGMPTVQWGSATTNGSGLATVTFPQSYSSSVYAIQVTASASPSNLAPKITVYTDTISTSSFRIHTFDNTNAAVIASVQWFAIGL